MLSDSLLVITCCCQIVSSLSPVAVTLSLHHHQFLLIVTCPCHVATPFLLPCTTPPQHCVLPFYPRGMSESLHMSPPDFLCSPGTPSCRQDATVCVQGQETGLGKGWRQGGRGMPGAWGQDWGQRDTAGTQSRGACSLCRGGCAGPALAGWPGDRALFV